MPYLTLLTINLCIENTRTYGEIAFDKGGGTKVTLVHLRQTINIQP